MDIFEKVRKWATLRGIKVESTDPQVAYQRVLQEIVEVHQAIITSDKEDILYGGGNSEELSDSIGDSLITLINLAMIYNLKAEDCLQGAFHEIEKRKGLLIEGRGFVRYKKLNDEEKVICDEKQGNIGSEYFTRDYLTEFDFQIM